MIPVAEKDYQEARALILELASKFRRRFGGDFEEIFADACLHWLRSRKTWDPAKGEAGKRARFKIWNGLLDEWRRKQTRKIPLEAYPPERIVDRSRRDLALRLKEASDDARRCAAAAITLAPVAPSRWRKMLIDYLLELGWAAARIKEAFGEIREVLSL